MNGLRHRLLVLGAILLAGCSSHRRDVNMSLEQSQLAAGYGSLRQLLDDEASVDKILVIKSVEPATETLIGEIAATSAAALAALDGLRDQPPAVPETPPATLPLIEGATRSSIATRTTLDLLFSADTFEVRLLLCQGQALRYGRFLAEEVASLDPNDARTDVLEELASAYEDHYRQVVERLTVVP